MDCCWPCCLNQILNFWDKCCQPSFRRPYWRHTEIAAYTLVYPCCSDSPMAYWYINIHTSEEFFLPHGTNAFCLHFVSRLAGMADLERCTGTRLARQFQNLGIYLQQRWIVLPTVSTILCSLLVFAALTLEALGQDQLMQHNPRHTSGLQGRDHASTDAVADTEIEIIHCKQHITSTIRWIVFIY